MHVLVAIEEGCWVAGICAEQLLCLLSVSYWPACCCLQGCASDRLIDTAVMGGPKVFVVATLASSRPASPFAFRNYELPDDATPIADQLAACAGSCKHHVWEVGGCCHLLSVRLQAMRDHNPSIALDAYSPKPDCAVGVVWLRTAWCSLRQAALAVTRVDLLSAPLTARRHFATHDLCCCPGCRHRLCVRRLLRRTTWMTS